VIGAVFASLKALAGGWQEEANRRRKLTATDPAADALAFCAGELLEQVRQLSDDTLWLGVTDYATLHRISPQTVRAWIRKGELDAKRVGLGWLMRRDAKRARRLKAAA